MLERLIEPEPWIQVFPDTSELGYWPKSSTLQFIKIMIELIRVFDERVSAMGNSKLNLTNHMTILYINENIMSSCL